MSVFPSPSSPTAAASADRLPGVPSPYPDALPGARLFRGRTLDELLPQIRAALGADAVVVRRREGLEGGALGFFQSRFVEVEAVAGAPAGGVGAGPASVGVGAGDEPAVGGAHGGPTDRPGGTAFDAFDDADAWPEDVPDDGVRWLEDAPAAAPVVDTAPIDGAAFLRHLDAAVERRRADELAGDPPAAETSAMSAAVAPRDLFASADTAVAVPGASAAGRPSVIGGGPDDVASAPSVVDPGVPGASAAVQVQPTPAVQPWSPARAYERAGDTIVPAPRFTAPGSGEVEAVAGPASGPLEVRGDVPAVDDRPPRSRTPVPPAPAVAAVVPHDDRDDTVEADAVTGPTAATGAVAAATAAAATMTAATAATVVVAATTAAATTAAATAATVAVAEHPSSRRGPAPITAAEVDLEPVVGRHPTPIVASGGRPPRPGSDRVATPSRRTVDADVAEYGLVARGLSPSIARSVVGEAARHGQPLDPGHRIDRAVRAALARRIPRPGPREEVRTIAVAGAPGAGRTAAVGALAAAHARAGRRVVAVALAPADAGAALAAALVGTDAELLVVGTGAAAAAAIRAEAPDLCVVDTPAVRPDDRSAAEALAAELRALGPCETLVAVPGTHATSAVHDVLDGLAPLAVGGLVMTHRDRAERPGGLIGASIVRGVPVAYVTDGRAIALADPARLARMVQP